MPFYFETNVPHGNAALIDNAVEDGLPVLSFSADPCGGPESMWFCFRVVRSGGDEEKLKLRLKHFDNMLGGRQGAEKCMPVICYDGSDWQRLGPGQAEALPDGRENVVWVVDAPYSFADVAWCYPYGRPEVMDMVEQTGEAYHVDAIGVSAEGRAVERLANDYGDSDCQRPGVYLLARQHSGETAASFVLDGLLRRLAEVGDEGPLVWAVPLTNIDGVERGWYGKDNYPWDLNRAWAVQPMRHEVLAMQRDMRRWTQRCSPRLVLDFHCPGMCEADGVYTFFKPGDDAHERYGDMQRWAGLFAEAMGPDYARDPFIRIANYPSRFEGMTARNFAFSLADVLGFTFEVPYSLIHEQPATREIYRDIGARMAEALVQHLHRRAAQPE